MVSVRSMPQLSSPRVSTTLAATGFWKLGQPLWESYLVLLSKRVAPQTTQQYAPDRFSSRWAPEKAGSVPDSWVQ